ncbi:hypothetical protein Esti_006083 [Eimeria stiedai]
MDLVKPAKPKGNSTGPKLPAKEGLPLSQTFAAQNRFHPNGHIPTFKKAAHAPSPPKVLSSSAVTPGGKESSSKDTLSRKAVTSHAGSQTAPKPAAGRLPKSVKGLPANKGPPPAPETHETPHVDGTVAKEQPQTAAKGAPSSSPGTPRAPLPPGKLAAKRKDLQQPRLRLDGTVPEPLHTRPYENPALNKVLLGKWDAPDAAAKPEEKPKSNLNFWPKLEKGDYLLKPVPEKQKKWQPPRVLNAEQVEEELHQGQTTIHGLYDRWKPLASQIKKSLEAVRAEAARAETATGEAELGPVEGDPLTADNRLRVNRLSTMEAMGTFLLEKAVDEAWDHRQKLHSELRSNPAYTVEVGVDFVGGKLAADVHAVRRGVLRVETLDEDIHPDPYGPRAGTEAPLPHTIGLGSKETELVALNAIGKAAQTMKERLVDRFPYLDISWSRQPSFDETNFNDLFFMEPEATYADFPLTEDFLHSHDRIRLAAARISQCVENKDVTCRELVRMADDINAMYEPAGSREATDGRAAPWEPPPGFLEHSRAMSSPSSEKQEQLLSDPATIAELWDQRNLKYQEIEDEEEKDRMALLNEIVHEIYQQFGGEWSNRLPQTSVLVKLLREPQPAALREEVPNPQSIVLNYVMEPNEIAELVHSLLVPLIMERFYLFDMRFVETPSLLVEEAASVAEWCLASRALSRMSRIAQYILTAIIESRVPGLLRLLFRLNALAFFEYRISYSLHMLCWRGQANCEPHLEFERNSAIFISQCRQRGTVITNLAESCVPDKNPMDRFQEHSTSHDRTCSNFMLTPELSANDHALLLRRAKSQLNTLLQNSTSCGALRFNVEAISKLMPFMTEYTANMPKKEVVCDRLFDSYLTQAFFWAIGDHTIPDSPQAVSLVTSYIEMLTETLYAMRSPDTMQRINHARHSVDLGLWQNLRRSFHPKLNVFLCRTILCFIADLMYMTCLDGAPLLLSLCREMHQVLQDVVVPTLRDKRPDLATDVTWDYCWRTAVCLREVFENVSCSKAISSNTLLPYTLVSRCGLRAGGPWPSLWQSVWEPEYHQWLSGSEQPNRGAPLAETKGKAAPTPPVQLQKPEKKDGKSGGGVQEKASVAVPPHRLWKGSVIPCWLPGCKTVLHQAACAQPSGVEMHYCPECYIASYCSARCRKLHYAQGHAQVCLYFKQPPTFLRFHMLKDQIPRQMKYPIMNVFFGLCDFNFTMNVKQEDFHPIF